MRQGGSGGAGYVSERRGPAWHGGQVKACWVEVANGGLRQGGRGRFWSGWVRQG